jgi:hypothetical protein
MASPKTAGRMINKSISDSKGFAALSPHAAVLFAMIIPHQNSYGKLNGGPGYIKDEICPRIKYLTERNIKKLLKEISDNTSMKWFEFEGRFWIHSTKFLEKHQKLDEKKLGRDLLPSYSGLTPELLHDEGLRFKGKVEEEGKGEEEELLPAVPPGPDPKEINRATWKAYREAYHGRYSIDPIRNAKVNGIIAKFTKRVPQADAADVAAFYVSHNGRLYVQSKHCLDLLIRDAEKIYSDWATNRQTTETEARQIDETSGRGNVWNEMIEKNRRGEL